MTVPGRARVIYDAEAIFAERDWRQAEMLGSEISSDVKSAWLDRELALAKAADAVVVVSERDRETMVSGGVHHVSIIGHRVCANPTAAAFLTIGARSCSWGLCTVRTAQMRTPCGISAVQSGRWFAK